MEVLFFFVGVQVSESKLSRLSLDILQRIGLKEKNGFDGLPFFDLNRIDIPDPQIAGCVQDLLFGQTADFCLLDHFLKGWRLGSGSFILILNRPFCRCGIIVPTPLMTGVVFPKPQ